MKITPTIFKAYDVRGLVGSELTAEVAEAVGRALADFLPEAEAGVTADAAAVCVGYDMRPDSAALATALRAGLTRQGRDVIDIGRVATDMIYFATGYLNAAGGVMVTASHNPGSYNGFKLCGAAARPLSIETGLGQIRDAIAADSYKIVEKAGRETQRNIMPEWIDHALSFIRPETLKPFHIAVDAGNGMAGAVMPHLDDRWPLLVEPMFYELDGTFPNHIANPLIDENNRFLVAKIREENLDFGVAFDGDGDRAFLVDELGRIVPGHIMSAMLAKHFLGLYPGANIIYDVRNSRLVEETIVEFGGHPVMSRVGHSYIKQMMREYDAPFGCEFSGHFYFRDDYFADSGLIAVLVAVQVLSDSGLRLSELVDGYASRYARSAEINFEVKDKLAKLAEIKNVYANGEISELDGVTVNYPNWWFNVRPSNTEPLLRLNVEARSPEQLETETAKLSELITR